MKQAKAQRKYQEGPVFLRQRKLTKGRLQYVLDIYIDGERKSETLKGLILIPEKTKEDRQYNKKITDQAKKKQSNRANEVRDNGKKALMKHDNTYLIEWIKSCRDEQIKSMAKVKTTYNSLIRLLNEYLKGKDIKLRDLNKNFCLRFIQWLQHHDTDKTHEPLKESSINLYCSRLNYVFNRAIEEELMTVNPYKILNKSYKPKPQESECVFLTEAEVQKFMETPCRCDEVRKAFIFACACGLRISDMKRLTWGNIIEKNGKYSIKQRLQKRKYFHYVPLPDNAMDWLPTRYRSDKDTDIIFDLPKQEGQINNILKNLAKKVGIEKNLSFHVARHTCATLLLNAGVPIEVVREILGHKDIKTTLRYAKVTNSTKVKAMDSINDIFKMPE